MKQALSFLLRPKTINDIIGQSHLINQKYGLVSKMIKNNFLTNLIFYGPPGIGKTSMAISLANDLNFKHKFFNASKDKKEKLQSIINLSNHEEQLILIIDEIHRMNRNIQDYLLEFIESRKVIVFLTTTENPYFVINPAIRSRCNILKLKEITNQEMEKGINRVLQNHNINLDIEKDAYQMMCSFANGDLRIALNSVELLVNLYKDQKINKEIIFSIFDEASYKGTGEGDEYHDLKSALQKSIRGSDVDASLHYWARLMQIGDFETLMRRMVIMAYEDIGLANPTIPIRVFQACQVFRQIGMPEGRIILGLAIVEMALSEKSNSAYLAIEKVLEEVKNGITPPIPAHLRDTHYKSASKFGSGIGYKYPHDYKNDWVEQQYLPLEIKNNNYFLFKPHSSYEKKLMEIYIKFTNKNNIK
ncbi:replication-associated recombination protein A [Spiroplasma taiwanense]|uniref:Recombination factor protein RarA n=1 Tax=Spiroplasma taiwanense CT-1 TaxID=1276220 RepID=S5MGN8_9MOLU|nr:replication-associated recombination protein A [Spiroplasma taiwanense]AGR41015.1 recombination factor protein RarA [Spiroplasma taiwanense CT-1]